MKKVYHKLVRDKIPDIIAASGKKAVCHVVDQETALEMLATKLQEEAVEYAESREIEELADVLEVIRAIAAERGVALSALERIRAEKEKQRGGFARRIVLEEVWKIEKQTEI
ncbi:MAG: nucleoside triphosphate pyrophosphohydrolase [Clostridia bacterium]|nr:nucleoside triphosphate pyrophosphohydrolase [Clostridia bacterium]